MAEETEHIQKLIAARDRQIGDRRNAAAALTEKYSHGHTVGKPRSTRQQNSYAFA
jgi:hypothetical protein